MSKSGISYLIEEFYKIVEYSRKEYDVNTVELLGVIELVKSQIIEAANEEINRRDESNHKS